MGSSRQFTMVVLLLVAALVVALGAFAWTLMRPDLGAARVVTALIAAALVWALVRHVERTNVATARFVEAVRHRDWSARVSERGGAGFDALGAALNDAMRDLQASANQGAGELRFWEALVDDVPVALLSVEPAGVRLLNKAARRLFAPDAGTQITDFAAYGDSFAARLAGERGGPEILPLQLPGGPQRAIVRTATLARLGTPVRVVAVEPIGRTLDTVEVGTQSDVVRVLAHEILNSLTPVTSLAGTAAVLLGEEEPDVAEARLAVTTLAHRAEGLRRFIASYREVARPPEVRRRRFEAAPFARELARLFEVEWLEHRLEVSIAPDLILDADPDLLAQVLINLLRNAAQATGERGQVRLTMAEVPGSGTNITVEDDGPGVKESLRSEIFLPFFTTRREGTGVGLSLVRQILVAHGWRIAVDESELGGARFRLTSG